MKMNLKLTADELMDVVDAAVGEALDRGYDGLDVDELTDDMCHIVDAALSAMGIEIVPAGENNEEEEEEEVDDFGVPTGYWSEFDEEEPEPETDPIDDMIFDHNGKRSISESDGKLMLDMCFNIVRERNPKMSVDQQIKMAQQFFLDVAHEHGIEWVVEDEDE